MSLERRSSHAVAAVLLIGLVACSTEKVTPPAQEAEIVQFDPTLGALAGQASMPGLMLDLGPDATGVATGCEWDAAVQRVVCAPVTRSGMTIRRSFVFLDAGGNAQGRRTETTVAMNTRIGVTGTIVTDRGSITIDRDSDLTVSGLAPGSTSHTLNGTEAGRIAGTHRTDRGTISTTESFNARTDHVVVPVPRSPSAWPLSGTSSRRSSVTAVRDGSSETRTRTFGHQVTFNGTRFVPVTLSHDGTTIQCTLDLATHRTDCRR